MTETTEQSLIYDSSNEQKGSKGSATSQGVLSSRHSAEGPDQKEMQDAALRGEEAGPQEVKGIVDLHNHDASSISGDVTIPERGTMARPRRPATLSKWNLAAERQPDASTRKEPLTIDPMPKSPLQSPPAVEMQDKDTEIVKSQQAQIKRQEEQMDRQKEKIQSQNKDVEAAKMATFRANHNEAQAMRHARETDRELRQREMDEVKRHNMLLGHRDKIREPILDPEAPGGINQRDFGKFLYSGACDRIREMRVKLLIVQAQLAHENEIFEVVINSAKEAEKVAVELGYEPLCQKCRYWQAVGIIGGLQLDPCGSVNKYQRSDVDFLLKSSSSCYKRYPEGLHARDLLNGRTTHRMH
ncbi:hypothetical protein EV356DRAFT_527976 [Viridothelium virens]|uniref:Uncharacterized protein n=1 Tax=Viridothelium virens TaxID=1048519 RepID=A0A6A6HQM5_VIRVR|nr:hypothetical protein EV356DRAFT_527976 [Viridothelium virens]